MGRKLAIGLVVVVVIGAGLALSGGKLHLRLGEYHAGLGHGKHTGHHRRGGMERTITVGGSGAVLVAPDRASLSIGVRSFAKEPGDALDENNVRMARIIEGLKSLSLSKDEIHTTGFRLSRLTRKEERKPGNEEGFVGYNVRNNINIRTEKIDLIDEVLDKVVDWGATEVRNLNFGVSDESPHLAVARARAVEDATKHARELVAASGETLGRILKIDEGGRNSSRRRSPDPLRMDVLGEDVPVFLTLETIGASISVTFEIE